MPTAVPRPTQIDLEKWTEISQKQEVMTAILTIREELIGHVLQKCQEIYLEKETAKFIVSCAYTAWKRILHLNFLPHDKADIDRKEHWIADSEPAPCEFDSYAANRVKMEKTPEPKPAELSLHLDESSRSSDDSYKTETCDTKTTLVTFSAVSGEDAGADSALKAADINLDLQFLESTVNLSQFSDHTNFESASEHTIKSTEGSAFFDLKTKKSVLPEIRKSWRARKSTLKNLFVREPEKNMKMVAQGRVKIQATHSQKIATFLPPIGQARFERQSVKSALRLMVNEHRKSGRKSRNISFKCLEASYEE